MYYSFKRHACLAAALFLLVLLSSAARAEEERPTSFEGVVRTPSSVQRDALMVNVFDCALSSHENERCFAKAVPVGRDGVFHVEHDPGEHTHLEITGMGVRRARFPWPAAEDVRGGARPVFRLESGAVLEGIVIDGQTGNPIAGALAGPVIPGYDAPAAAREFSYPFFVESDAQGQIVLTGLLPRSSYEVPVHAEGYQRRRVTVSPGEPFSIALEPGGHPMRLRVLDAETNEAVSGAILTVSHNALGVHVEYRADEEGRGVIDGLPDGEYLISARREGQEMVRQQEIALSREVSRHEWPILLRDGIAVSGKVVDIESRHPVANAWLSIGEQTTTTNSEGDFHFTKVRGPWPKYIQFDHDEFIFDPEDQDYDYYPINGYLGENLSDVELRVRRERVMVVTVETEASEDGSEPPFPPAVLELFETTGASGEPPRRQRLVQHDSIIDIPSAGYRLALLRTGDWSTEVVPVNTASDETTTSLHLTLGAGSRINGFLRYGGEEETDSESEPQDMAPSFTVALRTLPEKYAATVTIFEAQPARDGSFSFGGLPPGEFLLRFERQDGPPYLERIVELERGGELTIEETVGRGSAIAGFVRNEEGEGLSHIVISAYGTDPQGNGLHLETRSSSDGAFRIDGFGGDMLQGLYVDHHGYEYVRLNDIPLPTEDLEIVLHPKEGILVRLGGIEQPPATARAYVLFANRMLAPDGTLQWFSFVESMEPFRGEPEVTVIPRSSGRIRVAAVVDGRWGVSPPIEWQGGGGGDVYVLHPAHDAHATVHVEGWEYDTAEPPEVYLINTTLPEEEVTVEFLPTFERPNRLRFADLPAGDYLLLFTAADGRNATKTGIEIDPGRNHALTISLEESSIEFAGVVLWEDNEPAVNARVAVRFGDIPEAQILDEDPTDENGLFYFPALVPARPYLLDIDTGEESFRFYVASIQQGEDPRVFVLHRPVEVEFEIPPALADIVAGQRVPFRLIANGGLDSVTFFYEGASTIERSMKPGSYRAFWGQELLGEIEVRPQPGPQRLVLPVPRPR